MRADHFLRSFVLTEQRPVCKKKPSFTETIEIQYPYSWKDSFVYQQLILLADFFQDKKIEFQH